MLLLVLFILLSWENVLMGELHYCPMYLLLASPTITSVFNVFSASFCRPAIGLNLMSHLYCSFCQLDTSCALEDNLWDTACVQTGKSQSPLKLKMRYYDNVRHLVKFRHLVVDALENMWLFRRVASRCSSDWAGSRPWQAVAGNRVQVINLLPCPSRHWNGCLSGLTLSPTIKYFILKYLYPTFSFLSGKSKGAYNRRKNALKYLLAQLSPASLITNGFSLLDFPGLWVTQCWDLVSGAPIWEHTGKEHLYRA